MINISTPDLDLKCPECKGARSGVTQEPYGPVEACVELSSYGDSLRAHRNDAAELPERGHWRQ